MVASADTTTDAETDTDAGATAPPDTAAEDRGLVPERRRDRQRRELIDEICTVARRQLAEGGVAAVSWRGIAREVGMGPASLYTYFSSLEALFTELIVRSFRSLADAVTRAIAALAGAPVGDRLLAGPLAYRAWALAHPQEFNLVFTDQLPGFVAAPDGPTVDAQTAIFRPMAATVVEARIAQGRRGDPGADPIETATPEDLADFIGLLGLFHGLTSLEVNHHLDWIDAPRVVEDRVRAAIAAIGLPAAAADTAERLRPHLDHSLG